MLTNATRAAKHRRALLVGISVSVSAHLAALAVMTVPGTTTDADHATTRAADHSFEALEVIRIAEVVPIAPLQASVASTAPASASASASSSVAPSPLSLEDRFASLSPATVAAREEDTGRPIVTSRNLKPVSQMATLAAATYGGSSDGDDEEEGGSGWSKFLGGIGIALRGGGSCPTPSAGPLILR